MHHRLLAPLAAALALVAGAIEAAPLFAADPAERLLAAKEATKALFHDRSDETGLRRFTPAAAMERLAAEGLFDGEKGDEIRRETLLLARKLAFEKRPDAGSAAAPSLFLPITSGESEPNDTLETADPIECDTTISAAVSAPGDVDWFTFTISAQRFVDLTIECDGDSTMLLWTSVGAPIEFDDDDGSFLCSKLARVLPPGTYAVEIRDFGDDGSFTYTLRLTCTAPPEPEVEPNDTLETAQAVGCESTVNAAISPVGDVDWHRFTLDSTYRVIAEIDCLGDSTLSLRDAEGELIEFDDDDGVAFCSTIERTLAAGDYALEVRDFGDNSMMTYRLRLVCVGLGGDETEPNDGVATADDVACGDALEARVDPVGDVDFWRLALEEPADVIVSADCGGSGANTIIEVFDSSFVLVAMNDDEPGSLCSRLALHLSAGDWFVSVRDAGSTAPFPYTIAALCLPPLDETEPNDSILLADAADCGATLTGRIHPEADVDVFAFGLDTQSDVVLEAECDGDARLTLRNASGDVIAFDDDSGPGLCPRIEYRLDPGTYFAEASASDPAARLEYALAIACVPPFPPESEPNDDVATAGELPCDAVRQGTILPEGDVDFWRLTLAERHVVVADVECFENDGTLTLLDAGGFEIEFDDDDGAGLCPSIARLLEPGDYFFAVRENGEDGIMPYRILATCVPLPAVDETEPNGTLESADPLDCDSPLRGVIESEIDADFWTFSIPSVTRVALRVAPETPALDPAIRLYDVSSGRLLRAADDAGGPEASIEMTLGAGTYAVEVRALTGADPFAVYTIEVDCAEPVLVQAGCVDDGHARDGAITAAGDAIEWIYDGAAGETVRIVGRSIQFDSHILLLAPDGSLVDFDDDDAEGLDAQIETPLSSSGPYRLILQSATPLGVGLCRVGFDLATDPVAPEIEPNDTKEAAQPLAHRARVRGARETIGDDDYFTFVAAENDVILAEVRTTLGNDNVPLPPSDLALELLDSDGSPIAFSEDEGEDLDPTILASLPASPGGVYFLRVTGLTASDYEIFFRFEQFPVTIVPIVPPKLSSGDPISIRISGRNVAPVTKRLTFTVDRIDDGGASTRLVTRAARAPVGIARTVIYPIGPAPVVLEPTRFRFVASVIVGSTESAIDFDIVVEP